MRGNLGGVLAFSVAALLVVGWRVSHDDAAKGAETASSIRPLGALLAEYWGAKWPEKEPELVAGGIDLAVPIHLPEGGAAAWPSLEAVKADYIRNLEATRASWMSSLQDLREVRELDVNGGAPFASQSDAELKGELESLAALATGLIIDAECQVLNEGDYQLDYLVPIKHVHPTTRGKMSFTSLWARYPWHFSYVVDSANHPPLDDVVSDIERLKAVLAARSKGRNTAK